MNETESKDESISRTLIEKGVLTEEQAKDIMKLPCEGNTSGGIAKQLLELPEQIASIAGIVLDTQINKGDIEAKIIEIKVAVSFQVGTNTDLKNDTARKAAIADLLNQNKTYQDLLVSQKTIHLQLEHALIEYQKHRDLLNALIAIAGMGEICQK